MNTIAIKSTLSAAAVALSLGLAINAKAGSVDETLVHGSAVSSETISYSQAELATEAGRAALEHRVREAAEQVCGVESYRDSGSLSQYADRKECYNQAVSQAMSRVGADQIAAN